MEELKFNVTDSALLVLKEKLKNNLFVRIGIKGSGCKGYQYFIDYTNKQTDKDLIFEFEIKILIDRKSIILLNNATLDYEKTLMRQGFKFHNPNEKSTCGCGLSFEV